MSKPLMYALWEFHGVKGSLTEGALISKYSLSADEI